MVYAASALARRWIHTIGDGISREYESVKLWRRDKAAQVISLLFRPSRAVAPLSIDYPNAIRFIAFYGRLCAPKQQHSQRYSIWILAQNYCCVGSRNAGRHGIDEYRTEVFLLIANAIQVTLWLTSGRNMIYVCIAATACQNRREQRTTGFCS